MPRYQRSRELDPIVGVSITGLFDFFVKAFGVDWLRWWEAGRPADWNDAKDVERIASIGTANDIYWHPAYATAGEFYQKAEKSYLEWWRQVAHESVWEYCDRHGLKRPNRCTTGQPAGCGSRELLRVFDQGLIYADEVMDDGQGEVEDLPLSVRGGIRASTGIANQPLKLVRVTLNNGRVLRLTPNHRLSVEGEWVMADELIPGMLLDFKIGMYQSDQECHLVSVNLEDYVKYNPSLEIGEYHKGYLTSIAQPDRMSASLAYFLGSMFGNGCCDTRNGTKRVRFTHERREVLDKISAIAEKLFRIRGSVSSDKRSDRRHELCFASKPLYDWLNVNGLLKPCGSKDLDRIPYAVRTSSTESLLGFFCGLIDTDGCVRTQGSLSVDSSSEKFIRNLQQVGEAIGLVFSVGRNTEGENFQEQKMMWHIGLSRMLSLESAIRFINANSVKAANRPIPAPKRQFDFNPFAVKLVEFESEPDYSFDFAIEGADDDDSWYWQGAIKSHNTKSLLTGASPGFHPPKAQRYIRRITFRKNDPVALACIDYGYNVVPSQSDKDESGVLLDDPFDPRCTEWLVEIPCEVSWAGLPGADEIAIEKFSALAQFDFYMQVQRHYARHNVSATLELTAEEVEPLGDRIYQAIQNDEGYISAALLARFDAPFPRLPFEKIDKATFDRLSAEVKSRRKSDDFHALLSQYDEALSVEQAGPAGCDSDKCLLPEIGKPKS